MSRFKATILILGLLAACIAASLATLIALSFSGALVTDPVQLVFTVADNEKFYDGEPLVPEKFAVQGLLFNGHKIDYEFTGSQTSVGESQSGINVKIVDENGFDVSDEYAIKVIGGKLTVEKSTVLIYLNAEEAVYSGDKYVFDNYTLIEGTLAEGHKPGAAVSGAGLINAGDVMTSKNAWPAIYDAMGKDVSENYEILFNMGEVKVNPRPLSIRPVGAEKVYDGKPLSCERYEIVSGSLAPGHYAEVDFINEEGGEANLTSAGSLRVYADVTVRNAAGEDVTRNYALNVGEAATLRVNPRELLLTAKSATYQYDGQVHSFSGDHNAYSAVGLVSGESVSVTYEGDILNVGEKDNVISLYEISSGNQNYSVTTVAGRISVTRADMNFKLASDELTYGSFIPDPESYVTCEPELPTGFGIDTNIKSVLNEITEVGKNAYTITEYSIFNSHGDCTANFNISISAGIITVVPKGIAVSLYKDSYEKTYDGKPFAFDLTEINAPELTPGHKIVSVSCTDIVNAAADPQTCRVNSVTVYDGSGVDVSRNYTFNYGKASAQVLVTPRALNLSTGSYSKVYDGKPLLGGDISAVGLASGDYILTSQIELTDAGEKDNDPDYKIFDSNGDNAQDNYKIENKQFGKLTISKKVVNIGINNMVTEYGDTVTEAQLEDLLTGCTSEFTKDMFVFKNTEQFTNAGTYTLSAEYNGRDNQNYEVVINSGLLIINKKKINVTVSVEDKPYDGKPLTVNDVNGYDKSVLKIIDSNVIGIKDCGEYPVTASFAVKNDDTANYEITVTSSTFTISPARITLHYDSQSKIYDGTPFVVDCNDITVGGLRGLTVTSVTYEKITKVSESKIVSLTNTQFALYGEPVSSENFDFTNITVGITITPIILKLAAPVLVVNAGADNATTIKNINDALLNVNVISSETPLVQGDVITGYIMKDGLYNQNSNSFYAEIFVEENIAIFGQNGDVSDCYVFESYFLLDIPVTVI